jgi:hypothetical protein
MLTLLASIYELARVHALSSDEKLALGAVLVSIAELNNSERRTTAGIVNDLLHDTLYEKTQEIEGR